MKQIPYAAGVVSYYRKYIDLFYRDRRHRFRKKITGQCLHWETAVDLPTDITTGTMVLIW